MTKTIVTRFKDLAVGDVFEFDHSALPVAWSGVTGLWVKLSMRKYTRPEMAMHYRVGTIHVQVVKQEAE